VVTASPLIWPVLTIGTKAVMTSMPSGIWPAIRSVVIGAPPRYGTCVIWIFITALVISPTMWPIEPGPPEPKV
jgi:hypothetical protein